MSLVINTNIASLDAQRNLSNTQNALNKNLSHLSSGLRISSASDDAAGLAISTNLQAQIQSISQASRNTQDGVSLTQVAEGAMEQVGNLLSRMRELAVQASNGTTDSNSDTYINSEYQSLGSEINRIANVTAFNGTTLLAGGVISTGLAIQVGINNTANDVITVAISSLTTTNIGSVGGIGTGGITATLLNTQANAQTAIAVVDAAIQQVSGMRAAMGTLQNRFAVSTANLSSLNENYSAANSRIVDVDVASETADLTRNQILQQAGVAVLAQANQLPSAALSLLK